MIRWTENNVARAVTTLIYVICLLMLPVFTFVLPGIFIGVSAYNLTFLLASLSVGSSFAALAVYYNWLSPVKGFYRILTLSMGTSWLLGITMPAPGMIEIGLFWQPLWDIFLKLMRSRPLLPVETFIAATCVIAFWLACWGWGGLFKRHTTKKEPFLTRGTTPGGARIQRARWATVKEATDYLSAEGGIVLGEMTTPVSLEKNYFDPKNPETWAKHGQGPLLTISPLTGNGHVLVIQESSGFKTTGLVLPNILYYSQGPIVVLDPKENLYHRSAAARRKMGFNPVRICASDGLDIFKMLAPLIKGRPSIYFSLAKTLIPEEAGANENSIHFREKSVNLLAALLCYYMESGVENVLLEASRFLAQSHRDAITKADEMSLKAPMEFVSEELNALKVESEKSYPGLVAGIRNKIAFAKFPDVSGFLTEPEGSRKHDTILDPKTDIFLDVPTRVLRDFKPLLRLLTGSLLIASQLIEQPGRPRARRLFLLDEAKGLGSLEQLKTVRDEGRDIGLHLMLFYQSWGQVLETWKQGAQSWEDSVETRILGAVQSSTRSNEIVNMLGKDTIAVKTDVKSASTSKYQLFSGQVSAGENEQVKELALMNQSDLSKLPKIAALIMTRDLPPVIGSKAVYFTREDMKGKVRTEDEVAHLVQADRDRVKELGEVVPQAAQTVRTTEASDTRVDDRLVCNTPECCKRRERSADACRVEENGSGHPPVCTGCGGEYIDHEWRHSCKNCGVDTEPGGLRGTFIPNFCEACDAEARERDISSGNICGICAKARYDCIC